jgi:hypothetical protein
MKSKAIQIIRTLLQPKIAAIFVILLAVITTAFVLHKKDHGTVSGITVPNAYASELPGWWLKDNFGSSVCQQDACKTDSDPDSDKLTNAQEYYYHSNPVIADTNKNGLNDGEDVAQGFDPSKPGKVTFEDASSDDSIVGESLVFDKNIKQMFAEEVNPDKIKIPEPDPSLIKISTDNSDAAVSAYIETSGKIMQKYLPNGYADYIGTAASTQDASMIAKIANNSSKTVTDLSQIPVPPSALQLHKYLLVFYQLLPEIMNMPTQSQMENMTDVQAGLWYDRAQQFMMLVQKIDLEQAKISKA